MKITIDNHDGLGPQDYTQALVSASPAKVVRKLNKPSECILLVDLNATSLAVPSCYGRIVIVSASGTVLFTGYVEPTPAALLAGAGYTGIAYHWKVTAVSDEVLLDQQSVPATPGSTGLPLFQFVEALTQRVDPVRLTLPSSTNTQVLGKFTPEPEASWSHNAGTLASSALVSYRVLNGQLSLTPIGSVTHTLSEADGSLDVGLLQLSQSKVIANDVTVCGGVEAQAYVTDVFQGDGTTTAFELTRKPLLLTAKDGTLIANSFNTPAIDTNTWQITDPGSRLSLTSAGLSIHGGNGVDGGTTLTAIDNTEMGGVLVLTAAGVQVSNGSDGYLACFYDGSISLINLFAGFHVKQVNGSTVTVPVIHGAETGISVTLVAGHVYSFRLRYQSRDLQRVLETYYINGATQAFFGGELQLSAANLVFEVQDTSANLNQVPIVLYDGSVASAPGTCTLAAINSPAFTGSVQSLVLVRTGTAWVTSLQNSGSSFTRRLGASTIGADCHITSTDKLDFYSTSVPQAGEMITATYRTSGTSVARLFNPASVNVRSSAVVPGTSRWVGSVASPYARSSADCEQAALALLAISTNAAAGWSGKYTAVSVQQNGLQQVGDVWPGDVLSIENAAPQGMANVIVREVTLTLAADCPEVLTYVIEFANEWAEAISVKTSAAVPKTAWLPQTALAAPSSLANLAALVVSVTASQIAVSAGVAPPAGGGFEVRRVDWRFGPGSDESLVLRSAVGNFTILREAAIEQYFVRMYDGSMPPNYSRFSNAICVSVPL